LNRVQSTLFITIRLGIKSRISFIFFTRRGPILGALPSIYRLFPRSTIYLPYGRRRCIVRS